MLHLALLLHLLLLPYLSARSCNAISFEAGGDKGSFQAGAMFAFTHLLDQDSDYDVVTGVSVGSINSFGIALTEKGDFEAQANILGQLWSGLQQSEVFHSWWPFGIVQGLIFKNSLFNFVIQDYLAQTVQRLNITELKRPIMIGSTNLTDGRFIVFGNQDLSNFILKVRASASMPAAFNPTIIDGSYFIDGGSVEYMMPIQAIDMCIQLGYQESEINLDLVMIETAEFKEMNMTNANIIQNLIRLSEIRNYYQVVGGVIRTMFAYPKVNYRYLVRPQGELDVDEFIPINFSQEHIQKLIAMGDASATYTYEMGEGTIYETLIEEMTGKKRGLFGNLNLKGTTDIYRRKTKFVDREGNTLN